jgi:Co/Zn/Cd efflux system component
MEKLAAAFILGGFLMVFGAVGGMEDPTKAHYFVEQLVMAIAGLAFAFVGTVILPKDE